MSAPASRGGERPAAGARDSVSSPASFTLARGERLTRSRLFDEAFGQGGSLAGRCLVLWQRRGADATLRLGVVASRRTFRRAVDRARAKRLLREAFRLNRHRLEGGRDIVLVARRRLLDVKRQEVERDLLAVAQSAGILKGACADAGAGRMGKP